MRVSFEVLQLRYPKILSAFKSSDGWCRARVRVTESSSATLRGGEVMWQGRLPSVAPYFVFTCNDARLLKQGELAPRTKDTEVDYRFRGGAQMTIDDRDFLVSEVAAVDVRASVAALGAEIARLKTFAEVAELPHFFAVCDYFRMPYEFVLGRHFSKQKGVIRAMDTATLTKCKEMLVRRPDLMMFENWSRRLYGLKELKLKSYFQLTRDCRPPPDIDVACRLYWFIKQRHKKLGHTLFDRRELGAAYLASGNISQQHLLDRAFDALQHKAIRFVDEQKTQFALLRDFAAVESVVDLLAELPPGDPEEEERDDIRCKPLTDEQKEAVAHCADNWLTCILGSPGHGKSEAIVHLVKHYKNILVVTYVGMAVDMLQQRVSGYEHVYTIHYVYFRNKVDREWIAQFDVVVIDECSNIDVYLFQKFLSVIAEHAKRLVMVGDLAQINPIKPGNPFRDLVDAYPEHVHHFTINLRVDPLARALADAAIHVKNNELERIDFASDSMALEPRLDEDALARQLVGGPFSDSVMDFQILILRNDVRNRLNRYIVRELQAAGLLTEPKNAPKVGKDIRLYPGLKITFTKNYKTAAVRNGELALIRKVAVTRTSKKIMLTLSSGKRVSIGDGEECVSPDHVDYGYAVTCNKAQGSEWEQVLFYMHRGLEPQWTREFAYVALSRAKKKCTVVGTLDELKAMCKNTTHRRDTLLAYMLQTTSAAAEFDDTMVEF